MAEKWTPEHIIEIAQQEPDRIKFWLRWHPDYLEACRAVVDNPPSFDRLWEESFPGPEEYRRLAAEFTVRQEGRLETAR